MEANAADAAAELDAVTRTESDVVVTLDVTTEAWIAML